MENSGRDDKWRTDLRNCLNPLLRQGQRKALDAADAYLDAAPGDKAFLVCMPTGSGKTGVIAMLAQISMARRILLLSPRKAVCEQLTREVGGGFFRKLLGKKPKELKRASRLRKIDTDSEILVSTFQKLSRLSESDLDQLRATVDLVIIDEGHSEPAPVWSKFARGFKCHRFIITATPYRNDLFQFDIDTSNAYLYTYSSAINDGVLLSPTFKQVKYSEVVAALKEELQAQVGTKCLIKCRSFGDVVAYRDLLAAEGLRVAAIHDQFTSSEPDSFATVPSDIDGGRYEVLVYQRKLDEGIDIPSAKIMVFTYAVASGRELVQAVGRVVRINGDTTASVLDLSNGSNEKMWSNYKDFDESISTRSGWKNFLNSLDTLNLLDSYLGVFPPVGYFGGGFKKTFDIRELSPPEDLTIPLASFCFMEMASDFSMEGFIEELWWRYHRNGELVERFSSEEFEILISVRFENSKFLKDKLFFQPSLEVMLARQVGNLLAVYDSRSVDHSESKDLKTRASISTGAMLALSDRDVSARPKEAHAVAVGTTYRRAERVSAAGNLSSVAAGQSNSAYALSMLKVDNLGVTGAVTSSYYLGINTGRVSDQRKRDFSLSALRAWLDDIGTAMQSGSAGTNGFIKSFSQPVKHTPTAMPSSVIVDLSELDGAVPITVDGNRYRIPADFIYLKNKGAMLQGHHLSMRAKLDADSSRLVLESDQQVLLDPSGDDFIEFLSRRPIKALYDDGTTYIEGNFYKVLLPYERGVDLNNSTFASSIVGVPELRARDLTEKGKLQGSAYTRTLPDAFDQKSIFALIDQLRSPAAAGESAGFSAMRNFLPGIDLSLCTDMGTEPADFVISSPEKVCFVHIKCGKANSPKSAAGSLVEVGGQALKNISHLISSSGFVPANKATLAAPWPSSTASHQLANRVRLLDGMSANDFLSINGGSSRDLLDKACSTISQRIQSNAVNKEIWIVAGRSFSRSHFFSEMAKGSRAAQETIQSYQLIDTWRTAAYEFDVSVRLFVAD